MSRKTTASLLAAAFASAFVASQAHASFVYDLRFAPAASQTVAAAATITNNHTATLLPGVSYTLQLWGQITGDTTLTNDGFTVGFVSLLSSQTGGGAMTAGGLSSQATLGTHVNGSGATVGTGGTDLNGDGIADWGSAVSTATTNYLTWNGGGPPIGYATGVADLQSQGVNTNTWEVLLGTFTVSASSIGTGSTTFTPAFFNQLSTGPINKTAGINYYQDGATVASGLGSSAGTTVGGVTFSVVTVPEPASLGVLALGAVGLLARRRK